MNTQYGNTYYSGGQPMYPTAPMYPTPPNNYSVFVSSPKLEEIMSAEHVVSLQLLVRSPT